MSDDDRATQAEQLITRMKAARGRDAPVVRRESPPNGPHRASQHQ
jgi:hypothetical protein